MTIRIHALLLAGLLLSGCSLLPAGSTLSAPWPLFAANWEYSVLTQSSRLRKLSAPELATTAERLNRQHARERTEEYRLRLAFFLALAPTPYTDRARALQLLDIAPNGDSAGRNHPLAQLLLPLLQEQKRQEESLAASQQRNRELQLNHDQMRQKLEAIREIELRMLERPPKK
jgi:hypothetical protein